MDFYGREREIKEITQLWESTENTSSLIVLTGRRRIGKTRLAMHVAKKSWKPIYLFVEKVSENLLCERFQEEIVLETGKSPAGKCLEFRHILQHLFQISRETPLTVIIDEFQEFFKINPSVFSEMQHLWDRFKEESKLRLIISGSVTSLMEKIFCNYKEPLFGRSDLTINLKEFPIKVVKEILKDYGENSSRALFDIYALTGGIPKYVQLACQRKIFTKEAFFDLIIQEDAPLRNEGRLVLMNEFGKDYHTYFSILALIASGYTSRSQVESVLGKSVSSYFKKLETTYQIIERFCPVFGQEKTKTTKFRIKDHFLEFWFRFIHKFSHKIEGSQSQWLKANLKKEYPSYEGLVLERFVRKALSESGKFDLTGSFWTQGFQNEIDVVAINETEGTALVAEVKVNPKKVNMTKLKEKSSHLLKYIGKYDIIYDNFSFDNLDNILKEL